MKTGDFALRNAVIATMSGSGTPYGLEVKAYSELEKLLFATIYR